MGSSDSTSFIWQSLDQSGRMKHLLKTEHLADCSFCLMTDENESITIRCHKFVLMCASPVFERMFDGKFEESGNLENIVLDDVSAGDFKCFIQYLYLRDEGLSNLWDECTLQSLIYLGKKFKVDDLTGLCFSTFIKRIWKFTSKEIIKLYVYAHQMDHQDLIREVTLALHKDPKRIYKSHALFDLNFDFFLSIIQIFKNTILQVQLFNVIERYCKQKGLLKKAPKIAPSKLCQIEDKDHGDDVEKKILLSDVISTAGNDSMEKNEAEKKEASNEEKNINKWSFSELDCNGRERKAEVEVEKKEALKEGQEKEKLKGFGNEAQNKEYVAKLLSLVSFGDMTASQFCNGPGRSSMMDFEMKYKILTGIAIGEGRMYKCRLK